MYKFISYWFLERCSFKQGSGQSSLHLNFKILTSIVIMLLIIQVSLVPVYAKTGIEQKKVLIIHTEDQFLPANIIMDSSIFSVLKSSDTLSVSIYSEYMENIRFNSDDIQNTIFKLLRDKYAKLNLDLIMVTNDAAWDFYTKNGVGLFPGVPVVFCGVTEGRIDPNILEGNITGNFKKLDINTTIKNILKVQPDTKEIAVVIGTSKSDAYFEATFRQEFSEYVQKVKANYIIGYSLEETKDIISKLPKNTVVIFISMFTDGAGNNYYPRDVVPLLREVSNVPIYSVFHTYLGYGILGGSLLSFSDLSKNAAEMALKILNGTKPSEIPVTISKNKNYFDWTEMKHWGINEKNLPEGSIIVNKNPSLWDTYKVQIIIVILVLIIQALLIIFLILQLTLKKKAEARILQLNSELEITVLERTEQLENTNLQLKENNAELEGINQILKEEVFERKKAEKEVISLNNDLENRVMERTQRLEDMNAILEKEVFDRKQKEEENLYLSYHDVLTGLHNRRFYEEEIKRLDTERNLPISIIIGDVNGLKLINDAFGHDKGDELLQKAAAAIKGACRTDDLVARWGGDEFVILLPKTSTEEAEEIVKRVRKLYSNEYVNAISVSISFGWDTKKNADEDILKVLKSTEDAMYKHKIIENEGMRGNTISTIINTLHKKNPREEQHSKRVGELCQKMGIALGLSEIEIRNLKVVGLLHDMGKIAIEEGIINKPGILTEQERDEMKRHPDIGYRIISSSHEMLELADGILAHHERWDGAGYPKGLKGEAIPRVARIIAIADSYDAMTSDRPYRKALSEEVVLAEIRNNAATQFDPEIARIFIEKVLNKRWD